MPRQVYHGRAYDVAHYSSGGTDLSATTTVAAAAPGRKHVVLSAAVTPTTINTVAALQSGSTVRLKFGAPFARHTNVLPHNPAGWLETASGEALVFEPDIVGSGDWSVTLTYATVPAGE